MHILWGVLVGSFHSNSQIVISSDSEHVKSWQILAQSFFVLCADLSIKKIYVMDFKQCSVIYLIYSLHFNSWIFLKFNNVMVSSLLKYCRTLKPYKKKKIEKIFYIFLISHCTKKWSFPLRISSVSVTEGVNKDFG